VELKTLIPSGRDPSIKPSEALDPRRFPRDEVLYQRFPFSHSPILPLPLPPIPHHGPVSQC
jgi:hypothetical protein